MSRLDFLVLSTVLIPVPVRVYLSLIVSTSVQKTFLIVAVSLPVLYYDSPPARPVSYETRHPHPFSVGPKRYVECPDQTDPVGTKDGQQDR